MRVKEATICRLCLKVAEDDFEIIHEITRKIFEVLLLKVNLNITEDPIVCKDCAGILMKCFDFKSICMDTEELILSFADGKKGVTFELTDINTVDIKFICRFCSNHLSGNNFVFLDTLKNDDTFVKMLRVLLPEMDIDVTKNPVICTSCRQHLGCYIKFVENCSDIEEKIIQYCQNESTTACVQVKLSKIQRFVLDALKQEKKELKATSETLPEIYDCELIKEEEEMNIKEHGVNFNETIYETSSEAIVHKLNSSCGLKPDIVVETSDDPIRKHRLKITLPHQQRPTMKSVFVTE